MSFGDRVRSSAIREELGVEPLLLRVERSQMRWLGHRVRVAPGRLPAAVTVAPSCALQMTFSQKGGLFFYTISDGPAGADCDYSYYSVTNHPIANNEEEASLVRNNSLDGLVTFKCIEHLFFKATCDKGEFYSANVTVACEDLRSNEDAAKRINPVTKGNMHNSSGSSKDQTVLAVVLVVLVVLAVVLVIWCKYKKKYGTNGGKNSKGFGGQAKNLDRAKNLALLKHLCCNHQKQLSKKPPKRGELLTSCGASWTMSATLCTLIHSQRSLISQRLRLPKLSTNRLGN
ncbi:hypothetical protein D4764_02G0001180 [Takifugu flavidus]|uniref:Uncharacterized protein n=1 Tax=Takifugu flavidus TaxID=433684 RepID=A0A5C6NN49_9TELE|nr:hypothetical protein D4764_02G0001180 [Takifugu flavidus]